MTYHILTIPASCCREDNGANQWKQFALFNDASPKNLIIGKCNQNVIVLFNAIDSDT